MWAKDFWGANFWSHPVSGGGGGGPEPGYWASIGDDVIAGETGYWPDSMWAGVYWFTNYWPGTAQTVMPPEPPERKPFLKRPRFIVNMGSLKGP